MKPAGSHRRDNKARLLQAVAIALWVVASVVNAESFYSYAECRSAAEVLYKEKEQLRDKREDIFQKAYFSGRMTITLPFIKQMDSQLDAMYARWKSIDKTCNQMLAAESRQRQEDRQQRESQQRIQLSQQEYQRAQRAEAQQENTRASAARQWAQNQQREREQAISAAQDKASRVNAANGAIINMFTSLLTKPNSDSDPDVDRVYDGSKKFKTVLKNSMPGGGNGAASAAQKASLMELKRYQSKLAGDLKATLAEIENFESTPSNSGSSSSTSTYRAATSLPMNTGGSAPEAAPPNPWGSDTAPISSTGAAPSTADTSTSSVTSNTQSTTNNSTSSNPWEDASSSNATDTTQSGTNSPIQLASADNPWATPPASSNPSQCDDIRADRVKFKWDWSDQKGRRCFSNAPDRANAEAGAVCCSW